MQNTVVYIVNMVRTSQNSQSTSVLVKVIHSNYDIQDTSVVMVMVTFEHPIGAEEGTHRDGSCDIHHNHSALSDHVPNPLCFREDQPGLKDQDMPRILFFCQWLVTIS